MNIGDYVGKRILIREIGAFGASKAVEEYRVLEVSPSGNYARIMNGFGRKFWKGVTEIHFVEELRAFEPHPEQKAAT